MSKRRQVNIRLDDDLVAEIDRLAEEEAIDRSEMARRLLGHGLADRRMRRAIDGYRSGSVTTWRAAEIADVSLYEMLDRIHEEGIAYDLDAGVLDKVGSFARPKAVVGEEMAPYGGDEASPEASVLRDQSRPARVRTLFVGESSPAGGTHFYRANSNLFRATQKAFAVAFGSDTVSEGPRFLREFHDRECWLVDLVDQPVNRLEPDERQALVSSGVAALARTIAEVRPRHIVAIGATIDDEIRAAMEVAGVEVDLLALPFPVRRWRAVYVRKLAEALARWEGPAP